MFELNQYPLLQGTKERPMQVVNADDLKSVGVNNGAYTLFEGDVITFEGDPVVISQKIRNSENSPLAYYVGVSRNGKPSWLSVSWFTRRDADGKPIGKFQELNLKEACFLDIYNRWRGKTIKGGKRQAFDMPVFDQATGQRKQGETRKQFFTEAIFE